MKAAKDTTPVSAGSVHVRESEAPAALAAEFPVRDDCASADGAHEKDSAIDASENEPVGTIEKAKATCTREMVCLAADANHDRDDLLLAEYEKLNPDAVEEADLLLSLGVDKRQS